MTRMFCVRCRKFCEEPEEVKTMLNKRNVAMAQGRCTNDKNGSKCGSKINTFLKKDTPVVTSAASSTEGVSETPPSDP
jgi:hypothetical protein